MAEPVSWGFPGAGAPPAATFKQTVHRYLIKSAFVAFAATALAASVPTVAIPAGIVAIAAASVFAKAVYVAYKEYKSDGVDPSHSYVGYSTPDEVRKVRFEQKMNKSFVLLFVANMKNLFKGARDYD